MRMQVLIVKLADIAPTLEQEQRATSVWRER
jgi:hypothetical protein